MAESAEGSIDIDASVDEVYDIITDLESYPDWAKGFKSVEIGERTGDGYPLVASQVIDAGLRELSYTLTYSYDPPSRIAWVDQPGGDVKLIEGSYELDVSDDGGTTARYELTIDPGFPVPGFMLRKAVKVIITTALDGLKARAEAG